MGLLIGLTGPSTFTQDCCDMLEEFFEANFVLLYQGRDSNINYWLNKVDGIVLAGGVDICPTVYGQSVWSGCNLSRFDIRRDKIELGVIDYCLNKRKIPILGICRGHQLLGVYHNLQFVVDISNSMVCHQPAAHKISTSTKEPTHSVRIIESALQYFFGDESFYKMPYKVPEREVFRKILREPTKKNQIWVNSFHHQALAYNPTINYGDEEINVIGVSQVNLNKELEEIIELMEGPNWMSCQYHPEYDWKDNSASRITLNRFKEMLLKR